MADETVMTSGSPAVARSGSGVASELSDAAFLRDFAALGYFGATSHGGVDREAATEADAAQRRWLAALLEQRGFRVVFDEIGNQFGLLELRPGAPYVIVGSHMDSQPTAGRFDGAYGVLAAAYASFRVARTIRDRRIVPEFNLAVVNWFNEEGSRFEPSMMGSSVYTGVLPRDEALATVDRDAVSVRQALDRYGFLGPGRGPVAVSCAEIHVEQGRILEDAGVSIGLVTATWAAAKYDVEIVGEQAHSGATVMEDRKDALYAAALLIVHARELADRFPGLLHTAVGELHVYPNSPVVVASRVRLLLDLRSRDETTLQRANELLKDEIDTIRRTAGVEIHETLAHEWGINPYQPEGVQLARNVAEERGYAARPVLTVAGHDSVNMKAKVPTVMLFVPSVGGISHNEREYTRDSDLLSGLDVLTGVVGRLVQGALVERRTGAAK